MEQRRQEQRKFLPLAEGHFAASETPRRRRFLGTLDRSTGRSRASSHGGRSKGPEAHGAERVEKLPKKLLFAVSPAAPAMLGTWTQKMRPCVAAPYALFSFFKFCLKNGQTCRHWPPRCKSLQGISTFPQMPKICVEAFPHCGKVPRNPSHSLTHFSTLAGSV